MRINEPITDREVDFPDDEPLVSRTDVGGRIVFANHVFVETSGYSEPELVGAAHNIVRHPHMPEQAFANLWSTIKAGRPWDGLVKNRAKSGDFYWVRANVTPVVEEGQVTGYISIRSKPTRAQTAIAEKVYADIKAGTAKGVALVDGEVVRSGLRARLAGWSRSVSGRLLTVTIAALLGIVVVGWLGFGGMADSNEVLQRVYDHDLVAVNQLRSILDRIRDNRNHIAQMTIALGKGANADQVLAEREPQVRANMTQITDLWRVYRDGSLTADQRALVERFDQQYGMLVHDVIEPAFALAHRGAVAQLNTLFEKQAPPLFQAAFDTDRALVDRQIEVGRVAYIDAVTMLRLHLIAGIAIGLAGMLAVATLAWTLLRSVRGCASQLEAHFTAIMHGEMDAEIKRPAAREFQHVTSMLRAMRAHLAFASWSRAEFERRASEIRRETVERMAQTIEQEAGAAVQLVAEQTGVMAADANAMAASAERVSANAQHVAEAADQAMRNVQIVAAAGEELAAAIREVSSQVDHASTVARGAAAKGSDAQQTIRSLSEAAGRIGAVVRLIAEIAGKTNLLALNATIEAARAGEAGKGFAVVAGEVKALASQTAKATEEISHQITGLRGATDAAVTAVDEIGQTLDQVAHVAVSVAAAIEEQSAATQEISRNVAESGAAVQEVTSRIAEVSEDAQTTGSQAVELRGTAGKLAGHIATLRGALVQTVRTATTEADRRQEARVAVEEPCTLTFGAGGKQIAGTIRDVSLSGAAISVPSGGVAAGEHGSIALGGGGSRSSFEVRANDQKGTVHIKFTTMEAGFDRAVTDLVSRMSGQGRSRAA